MLDRKPGIRVQDAAARAGRRFQLGQHPGQTTHPAGLVQRVSDPLDGRAAHLWLTPLSEEWVTRVGNAREAAIGRALVSLDEADRAAIEAAVPAMARLAKAIASTGSPAQ